MAKQLTKVDPKKAVKVTRRSVESNAGFDRLTIVGHITHEHFGDKPVSFPLRLQSMLDHDYQPVERRMVVSAKDTQIDTQWIPPEHTGMLIIENRAGAGMLTTPTPEEQEFLKKQVVRVLVRGFPKGFRVRPGKVFIAEPEDIPSLVMIAADQPVNVNIYIYPS
jgi:hypothetical protein